MYTGRQNISGSPSVLRAGQETITSVRKLGQDLLSPQVQRDAASVYRNGSETVGALAGTIAESARALRAALGGAGRSGSSSSPNGARSFTQMSFSSTITTAAHSLAVVLVNHPSGYHPQAVQAHCDQQGLLHPEEARLPPRPSMPARHVHFYSSPGAISSVWA